MQAFNFTTMTYYGGSNASLVGNGKLPAFATFNQLKSAGYMVKKGAKAVKIFCGYKRVIEDGKEKSVPKFAAVFDIVDTNAEDDKDFMKWLAEEVKAGRVKRSGIEADQAVAKALAG